MILGINKLSTCLDSRLMGFRKKNLGLFKACFRFVSDLFSIKFVFFPTNRTDQNRHRTMVFLSWGTKGGMVVLKGNTTKSGSQERQK